MAMNRNRRKRLGEIAYDLDKIHDRIETIMEEEELSLESLPEQFKSGERGEEMESNIDELRSMLEYLEEIVESLDNMSK